jgi:hypothetical protein
MMARCVSLKKGTLYQTCHATAKDGGMTYMDIRMTYMDIHDNSSK